MSRGLQLACERCDFSATLFEHATFQPDGPGGAEARGYWQDQLCGECRLPLRVACPEADGADAHGSAQPVGVCPHCGGETMPFAVLLHELAEACHSRPWVDLRIENMARARIERALTLASVLIGATERGDTTTLAALDELTRMLTLDDPGSEAPSVSAAAGSPTATHTLGGLTGEIENAASLENARDILRMRLDDSAGYIRGLEACVEDEASLPGVPCPQCETGRLIHWPLWT
ncbi:MAG TPA: hypothetical protein VJN88_02350 [Ktedonobacterales bacterium]|nr:hypothetical protein [Ktedonobacterales bacterium]